MTEVMKTRRSISIVHAAERARKTIQEIRRLVIEGVLEGCRAENGMRRVYIDSLDDYISKMKTNQAEAQQPEEVTLSEAVRMSGLPRDIITSWIAHGEVAGRTDHNGVLIVDFSTVQRRMKGVCK